MLGQLCVEPESELLEPEPDELDELDDPELLDPVFELLELDDGVVVEEFVHSCSSPSCPCWTCWSWRRRRRAHHRRRRPVVNAPIANTLRSRIFMVCCPFVSCDAPHPFGPAVTRCAPDLWPGARPAAARWWRFLTIG